MMGTSCRFLLLLLVSGLSACTSDDQAQALQGLWSINSFKIGEEDVIDCLGSNIIYFKPNAGCEFTKTSRRCPDLLSTGSGGWTLNEDTRKLVIHAKESPLFAGEYDVVFVDDTTKRMLVVQLTNKNRIITCRKGLFDYDQDRRLMQRVVYPAQ